MPLRVLRIHHAGRDPGQRQRDRALIDAGVEVTLVVPSSWPGVDGPVGRDVPVVALPLRRAGDINRHRYESVAALRRVLAQVRPDLVDVHEEPFSVSARQWLRAAGDLPVVGYTAQNVDKRFPPPFAQYEHAALQRLRGLYPCTSQAASVAHGKGFRGVVEILPLGYDGDAYVAGDQSGHDEEVVLALVGRLVPEKGVLDAVRVLAAVLRVRPARLLLVGTGPEEAPARRLAAALGVTAQVEILPWQPAERMAPLYREVHVLLLPSHTTQTWAEQFGRVMVEAQAAGAVVVGYGSGAIPEVAAGTALLVREGDQEALAAATLTALAPTEALADLRQSAARHVRAMTWRALAERQRDFYERVLAAPPEPRARVAGDSRAAAVTLFGPPAVLAGGAARPFALPVLRRDQLWTRALGATLDGAQGQLRRISRS